MSNAFLRWLSLALAVALAGCGGDETNDQPDGSADTDSDTDTDFDFDTDYPYDLDAGLRCDGGVDLMQPSPDGVGEIPTGVEYCPDDSSHRYAAVPCTNTINTVDDGCDEDDCSGCEEDEGCALVESEFSECRCIKPCASDADCSPDEACVCGSIAQCRHADCRVDDDCGGFVCGLSFYNNGCEPTGVALGCRSSDDECQNQEQCLEIGGFDPYCGYDFETGIWECMEGVECD